MRGTSSVSAVLREGEGGGRRERERVWEGEREEGERGREGGDREREGRGKQEIEGVREKER